MRRKGSKVDPINKLCFHRMSIPTLRVSNFYKRGEGRGVSSYLSPSA